MIYEVSGGKEQQRQVVDKAMSYVIHLLKIPNYVHVEFHLGIYSSHGVIQENKKRFFVEIYKGVSLAEIAYTVFHEMKHVEQMASGKLQFERAKRLWEGEDHTNTEYFDCPWEIEAYKFEKNADLVLTSI